MSEPVSTRILLVEDSPTDARLLQHDLNEAMGGAFEVTWVERLEDAVVKLREQPFDVGLLDLTLPDSSGIATFTRIQEAAPRLPIVVLTGMDNEAAGVDAIRRGIQDFLVKGTVDSKTVARAIRYAIERKQTQEEIYQANKLIEQRMADLQVANRTLLESRKAALNLMEDALLARKKAEQATMELRESREDLNRAQTVAQTGSWRMDVQHNVLTWSDENYRIFGIPIGTQLTYEAFLAAVHPKDRENVDARWKAFLEGQPYDIEHRIMVHDEVKWVRETAGLEYDEKGVLRGGFGTTQDITGRKRLETELAEKSRQLEKLVSRQSREIIDTRESLDSETKERMRVEEELSHRQQALEAVYAMATAFDTSFVAMNDQVVLSIAKILHTPLVSIHYMRGPNENRVSISSKFCRGYLTHDIGGDVTPCITGTANSINPDKPQENPSIRDCSLCNACFPQDEIKSYAGVPIHNSHGEKQGIICVLDSEERTFDEYDIRLIEIFARYLAHEQTQRELESQLMRSNELRVLGQLTSGVAHEVRNPLNGIMAIMSALSKELSDAERFTPYLQHMQNQVGRLTVLMEDLLAFGRPIREEKKADIPVVAVVQNALSTWQQSIQQDREVRFINPENGTRECLIRADGAKIEQAIINLLDNAHQHTPADKRIDLSVETAGFDRVRISIKDNGPGIPEEIMPRIFEPFFTTRKSGTGLGLPIVRHIVESHGGVIDVKNNKDCSGLTISIDLPLSKTNS